MKTQLSSICRRLSAAVLFAVGFGVSASMAAVTLADAHADLAAGNFSALKTDTATLFNDPASSQEAHVLHAIALLGLAAKNDLPPFLVSLGAKAGATIDPLGSGTMVDFPKTLVYSSGALWTKSGATFTVANAFQSGQGADATIPSISFENKGAVAYDLVLQCSAAGNFDIGVEKGGGGFSGYLSFFNGQFDSMFAGSVDVATQTVTIPLDPGDGVTLRDYYSSASVGFTIKGTLPTTLLVSNGKTIEDSHPKFATGANVTAFFTFAAKEDPAVLGPIVSDLAAVTSADFQMTLPAAETGHPTDIVIQYPDVQLIIGFIKFNQGLRLLSTSYNWSFDLSGGLFLEATGPLALMTKNASFLTAVTTASAASRTAAKALLDAAAQCYVNADAAGLWSRQVPVDATYLITVDTDESHVDTGQTQSVAERRASFLDGVTLFRRLLTEDVPVFDVFPGFAAAASLSDTATFSLAPFFAATPISIRGVLPTFTNAGIQEGTSLKLLASGVLKGVDANTWENYLSLQGVTDPDAKVIETAPAFSIQPAGRTVLAGDSQIFTALAAGYPSPTYQWKKNGVIVPGATGASYMIDSVQPADAASYTVVATNMVANVARSATSTAGVLVVGFAPAITTQPVAQNVKVGLTAKFTVVATGNPLPKYQWRLNGTPITGATLASYSVAASALKAGSYDVVVTNSVGSATSDAVVLTVGIPPVITTKPVAQTVTAGQSVSLTVVASGSDPKTYQWKKNNVNIPDATAATYMIDNVQSANAGSYIVTVTNGYGTVSSTAVTLAVNVPPAITTQPVSVSAKVGAAVTFTVVATGNPLPTYQWFLNGNLITGATRNIYSTTASVLRTGTYTVRVTNSVNTITSTPVTLSITPP